MKLIVCSLLIGLQNSPNQLEWLAHNHVWAEHGIERPCPSDEIHFYRFSVGHGSYMQHSCPPGMERRYQTQISLSKLCIHFTHEMVLGLQNKSLDMSVYHGTLNMISDLKIEKNNSGSLPSNTCACDYICKWIDNTVNVSVVTWNFQWCRAEAADHNWMPFDWIS
jgi:hypothetical protein